MKARKGRIKRPKFLLSYFVSAFICLIIMGVFGLFVLIYVNKGYETDLERFDQMYDEPVRYWLENGLNKEELTKDDLVIIKWYLTEVYSTSGSITKVNGYHSDKFSVADRTRPEFELDASRTALFRYVDENLNDYNLLLADNKYLKYFDTPEINALQYYDSMYLNLYRTKPRTAFVCKEFYADFENRRFIPVEVEILRGPSYGMGDTRHTGVTVSIKPDNVEGYTLIKPRSTEVYIEDTRFNQYGEIAGCADIGRLEEDACRYDVTFNDHHFYEIWKTGPNVVSFNERYKENIITGAVKFIWIALAFAFVPATISYNIKLRRFMIFEYRRKMIDAMAHDLKTPMAAITAYAENLSNHIGTDKQEHYAEKIEEKVAEMNRMVSSILEFSKSEDASVKIKKEETNIGQMIAKIISDNETTIKERSLKVNYEPKSLTVKTDKEMFRQALANLIGNAVIHCKEGTDIDIGCDKSGVVITNVTEEKIENTAKLKQAFVKGSSSRGNKGTGLGLAIADNNLAMLGYKLELKTEDDKFIATVKM